VIVSNSCGQVISSEATVTVNANTSIVTAPANTAVCTGSTATFTVAATGTNLTYQWFAGSTAITGATSSVLALNNVTSANAGTYRVVVTGTCGTLSATATLTVNNPIVITAQPANATVCDGTVATMTVAVSGTAPTYQWYNASGAISGATAATYTTTAAGTYYAVVTGTCNAITTANAVVTVNPLPQGILSGSTICAGNNGSLVYTSTVPGTGPYTLVYQVGTSTSTVTVNNVVSGVAFSVTPAATTAYTLVSVTDRNGCVRTNGFTAATATVTVNPAPTATLSGSQVICANASAVLNVTMTGTAPFVVTLSDGTQASFATNTGTITVNPNAGTTYTIVSVSDANGCSNRGTGSAVITLHNAVTIGRQPSSVTVCDGTVATLSVSASGTGIIYQWFNAAGAISGATAATYTTTAAGVYYVVATGTCNAVTSSNAVVSVNPLPQGSLIGSAICAGSTSGATLTFTSSVAGTGPYTVVYNNGTSTITVNNVVSGVAFPVSVIPGVTTGYTLVSVTDVTGCTRTSGFTGAAASITINPRPTAVLSGSQAICANGTATLSVAMTGTAPFVVTLNDGTQATFATNSGTITVNPNAATTYTIASVTDANGCSNVGTGSAVITLNTPISITANPANTTVCSGTVATLSVVAGGTGITYQWFNAAGAITGATAATYTTTASGTYYVVVGGACGSVTSGNAVVTVNPLPQGILTGSTVCANTPGATLTYTSGVAGTGPYTIVYSTLVNGLITTTATNVVSGVPFAITGVLTNTTAYSLVSVTDVNGCVRTSGFTTGTATITVLAAPAITSQPVSLTQNVGTAAQYTVAATGANLSYQWQISTDNGLTYVNLANAGVYSGVTTATLQLSTISVSMNGYLYRCVVSGTCAPAAISNGASLTVVAPVAAFTVNTANQCFNGNQFVFTNTSSILVGSLVTYQWTFGDGVGTSSLASPTYTYTRSGTYVVKLVVISDAGLRDSTTRTVVVYSSPIPSYTINQSVQCLVNNRFVFTNTSILPNEAMTLTYRWEFGDGTTVNDISPVKSYASAGTYNVKLVATSINGCRDSVTQAVTVNPMPVTTVSANPGTILCQGSSVVLTATGGVTYKWYRNGALQVGITGPTFTVTSPGEYSVRATSAAGCESVDVASIVITLLEKPVVDFTFNTSCAQFPITFTNRSVTTNSGPVTFLWTDNFGNTSTVANPVITYATAGVVNMKLKVIPTLCPVSADSITKSFTLSTAAPALRLPTVHALSGEPVRLQARSLGSGSTYMWTPGGSLDDSTLQRPTATLTAEQEYRIRVTTAVGCQTVDTMLVRVFRSYGVYVANVFTPNTDGINDRVVMNMVGIRSLRYFRIFDRTGKMVYVTSNAGDSWDGTFNGNKMPTGTYMWVAEAVTNSGINITERGLITLIR
jgi:gliding motility-associated-like protein